MQKVSLKQISELLIPVLKAGIVPYLKGSPAIGKSSVAHQIAEQLKLKVIDVRLAECDPTDLQGFPFFDQETKKASYYPLSTFPTEIDEIPDGYNGWLILLDEFSNAPMAVQASAYKLVLDRQVGQHKLHSNALMIAAGNLETDNACAQPMSSALVSRFAIFEVECNTTEWLEWANEQHVDYRISAFINFKPDLLYTFNPNLAENPYASPRTWMMLNSILQVLPNYTQAHIPLFNALVGESVANEFALFVKLQDDLPTFDAIVADPKGIKYKTELSIQWSLISMVADRVTETTTPQVVDFIQRFSKDLQIVAMRQIIQRHFELRSQPAFKAWEVELSKIFV